MARNMSWPVQMSDSVTGPHQRPRNKQIQKKIQKNVTECNAKPLGKNPKFLYKNAFRQWSPHQLKNYKPTLNSLLKTC